MRTIFARAILGAAVAALALAAPLSAAPKNLGKPTAQARPNIQKPQKPAMNASNRPGGGNYNTPGQRPGSNQNVAGQRPGGGNRNPSAQRPGGGRGNGNVVAGNTVVVGGQPGRGYYDNGRYYDRPEWDDDDNDFLEFIGKTAAITAGVSAVSAVIGSVVKDKPDDCQPINVGGQPYLNCNGVAYQQVQGGYQVVAPPQ